MKKIAFSVTAAMFLLSSGTFAADVCANLPGVWTGNGKVIVDVPSALKNIKCRYEGTSTVTSLDASSHVFTSEVEMQLISGICPPNPTMSLSGICQPNGDIVMVSADGSTNLEGKLNKNGNKGTIKGDVAFEMSGQLIHGHLEQTKLVKS